MSLTPDKPFLVLDVEVTPPADIGPVGAGARRFIPIVGGQVSGELAGEILSGGADWQTVHDNGLLEIDARYVFRTSGGALVEVHSAGVRAGPPEVLAKLMTGGDVDPSSYYFRTAMRFRTAAPELAHLNALLAVAKGQRRPRGVRLEVFAIL
jgi:hypothetical protein